MAYRDLLLTALTYPDATPERALRSGVALAKRLGGALTLLTVKVQIPRLHNPLANAVMHLDEMAQAESARSAATAALEEVCARVAADIAGEPIRTESLVVDLFKEAEIVAGLARTRDLALCAIGPAVQADRQLAEALLFDSGRPVLIYPEALEIAPADSFGTVAVAWDGGPRAARAVADAMPLLQRARDVRVFTALGDKPQTIKGTAHDLLRHLETHGVTDAVDERIAHDKSIGCRLTEYTAEAGLDLLVMGGYGHPRLREFVLGGATDAMLDGPPCPVLMSH
jgi:nucleotide-binding universal stress UspA family protein